WARSFWPVSLPIRCLPAGPPEFSDQFPTFALRANEKESSMNVFRMTLVGGCLLLGLMDAACSNTRQSSTKKLAFVTNNAADFWTIARKGCEQADRELAKLDVELRIPSDGTAAEQRRIVDDLLAKGVSGMAISPVDPVNQTQMINEVAKQILLLTQDSDAPQSDRACYLGTDNVAAGRQAGELIKEALPQGGKIMVFVGKSDARNAQKH